MTGELLVARSNCQKRFGKLLWIFMWKKLKITLTNDWFNSLWKWVWIESNKFEVWILVRREFDLIRNNKCSNSHFRFSHRNSISYFTAQMTHRRTNASVSTWYYQIEFIIQNVNVTTQNWQFIKPQTIWHRFLWFNLQIIKQTLIISK